MVVCPFVGSTFGLIKESSKRAMETMGRLKTTIYRNLPKAWAVMADSKHLPHQKSPNNNKYILTIN